ncbi:MAG: lysophospholipid acyltransferase family protein [Pseudomonas sp.]
MIVRYWRYAWRTPAVVLWIVYGLLLGLGMQVAQMAARQPLSAYRQRLAQHWMRGLTRILPLRLRCHGTPAEGAQLLVSNHVSWLDIVVIGACKPARFLSKAEVLHWPVIGWLASAAGTLFIQRGQAQGQSLQDQLGSALNDGDSLVIFAEGTTTAGDRVRTFHGRLLSCAIETDTAIQPVALAYRRDGQRDQLAPFVDDDEFSRHLLKLLGSAVIDVDLHFLEGLDSQLGNRNQLARKAQAAVTQTLGLGESQTASGEFLSSAA